MSLATFTFGKEEKQHSRRDEDGSNSNSSSQKCFEMKILFDAKKWMKWGVVIFLAFFCSSSFSSTFCPAAAAEYGDNNISLGSQQQEPETAASWVGCRKNLFHSILAKSTMVELRTSFPAYSVFLWMSPVSLPVYWNEKSIDVLLERWKKSLFQDISDTTGGLQRNTLYILLSLLASDSAQNGFIF